MSIAARCVVICAFMASGVAIADDMPDLTEPIVWVNFERDGSGTHALGGSWEGEGIEPGATQLGVGGAPQGEAFGRLQVTSTGGTEAVYTIPAIIRPGALLDFSVSVRAPELPEGVVAEVVLTISDGRYPDRSRTIELEIPAGDEWAHHALDLTPVRRMGSVYYLSAVGFRVAGLTDGQTAAIDVDDLLLTGDVDTLFEEYLPEMALAEQEIAMVRDEYITGPTLEGTSTYEVWVFPASARAGSGATLRGAPGETVGLALTTRARVHGDGLVLRFGPLAAGGQSILDPHDWDIRHRLENRDLLVRDPNLTRGSSDSPRYLPSDVSGEELHTFVALVTIPEDAPSGTFSGEALIRSSAGEDRIPYSLEVLPLDVSSKPSGVAVELRSTEPTTPEQRRAVLEDIRDLGADAASVGVDIALDGPLDALREELELRAELGLTRGPTILHGSEAWFLEILRTIHHPQEQDRVMQSIVSRAREIIELAGDVGIEVALSGVPGASADLAYHQNETAGVCKALGIRTYIQGQPGISHATGHVGIVSLGRDDDIDAKAARRMGFELWFRPTRIEAGMSGFGFEGRGYSGLMVPYWPIDTSLAGNASFPSETPMLAYPTERGPVRTANWLRLHEAIRDRQYVTGAEELLTEARATAGVGGFGARPSVPEIDALTEMWTQATQGGDMEGLRSRLQDAMVDVVRWMDSDEEAR